MKQLQEQTRSNIVNETVADIIVNEVRTRYRKTGEKTSSYTRFDVEDIAKEVGGRDAFFKVSTWGVAQALNSVKGINARYDNTSFQIGPCECLEIVRIELD